MWYLNVNEISYYKDIAYIIPKELFELQPEDGFIKKPKHVADLSANYFYRSADKSLALPGKKQATATEDFDVHISYL